jgi:hypothetical protein
MKIYDLASLYKCEYQECETTAEDIVYNRKLEKVGYYCEKHAAVVLEIEYPEYEERCPNCKCLIPVA